MIVVGMTLAGIVNEIHEIIAQKKPKGTSEYAILAKAIDSFIPQSKTRISEEKAREIVFARGALARKRLEQAEGGAVSAEEVADLLGLSRQGVDYLRKAKRVAAWRLTGGKWHYPLWQFHEGRVRRGISECLRELPSEDPWSHMIFFLSPRESLSGRRPLDLILSGDVSGAVAAARRHQRHGAY
jgi:DNA-binding GntR family transcriptional regulator